MPRLLDVANAAGVSLRTASRVLNDDPRVAPDTRQRVQAAITSLRFSPDAMARSLRAGTDTAIGFVVESISDPFFAGVIDAVEQQLSPHGRPVLVASTRRDAARERDVVERMLRRRVAGLLLSPANGSHDWLDPRVPVVLVDRPAPGLAADLVDIDDHRAAFDAVVHLIARDHQRIAYVGDTPAIATSAARLRGYRDALAAHGLAAAETLVRCDCDTSEDAARAISALLDQDRPPTAILSATIRASLGVVPALHAAGRTDIALVAFGDFPMAGTLRPAITVVDHPGHEVGKMAATRLLHRLAEPALLVERIRVPARIIERGSGELRPLAGPVVSGATDVVIGLDIGTTSAKAVIRPAAPCATPRNDAHYPEHPTPWRTHPGGQTEIDPHCLTRLAVDLIGAAVRSAEQRHGPVRVRAIGVTGLAESGVLLDPAGHPVAPAIAWFDHRGARELDQLAQREPAFAAAFARTTGLPWSCQASLAKLLWLHASGHRAGPEATWLSVPEWIVFALGGDQVREPSLASRTGLIDQGAGQPWPEALAAAGLPDGILPAERVAGQPAGRLTNEDVTASAAGAVLTVAGHDHPVAAIAVGATGPDELFNSSGTADVLARSVPGPLDETSRQAIVNAGWSAGRHVLPDASLLLAGVSGGLLLRRVLTALGAETAEGRAALDQASLEIKDLPPGLEVTGDGRRQDDVVLRIQDGATPAAIWTAAVHYTADQASRLLTDIEKIVGPHQRAVAAGGWTQMASVRAAKAAVLGPLSFSPVVQPGVTGAALLACYALEGRQ